jgi:hypothetical protein
VIRETFQNLISILHTLFVILAFIELDNIFEKIGFLFGEGTALAGLRVIGGHNICFVFDLSMETAEEGK